jgi:hypothetical protein
MPQIDRRTLSVLGLAAMLQPKFAWAVDASSDRVSTNASLRRRETQFSRAETKTPKRSLQSNRQIAETKYVHKSPSVRGDLH